MGIINAGTYKFLDTITLPTSALTSSITFELIPSVVIQDDVEYTFSYVMMSVDSTALSYYKSDSSQVVVYNDTDAWGAASDNSSGMISESMARIVKLNNTVDDAPDEFYNWFTQNTEAQSTEGQSTIIYNNNTIATFQAGQTATLVCADKKATSDILVNFASAGKYIYNATEGTVAAGQTAKFVCLGKKMLYNIVVELDAEGGDLPAVGTSLEDCTWAQISAISAAGRGAEYFSVGDMKSVLVSGTVGTLAVNNTLYVYILGFNHDGDSGIIFGTFKTASGIDICLVDSGYGSYYDNGTKYFNMNHWGNYNYGGWSASDLRYDILGSTNVAPSGYGSAKTTSSVGYDASSTCATNPVAGTLMAALPEELRAVMKPMTVYTDNTGNNSNSELNVTATVDYLPLLAEFEVHGARSYANTYEQNSQAQFSYFANGASKIKYKHADTTSAAYWWVRSPTSDYSDSFCRVGTGGSAYNRSANFSFGLAPAFKV